MASNQIALLLGVVLVVAPGSSIASVTMQDVAFCSSVLSRAAETPEPGRKDVVALSSTRAKLASVGHKVIGEQGFLNMVDTHERAVREFDEQTLSEKVRGCNAIARRMGLR